MQCGIQSSMTSSIKLMCQHSGAFERKWNGQLTRPIFLAGAKNGDGDETMPNILRHSYPVVQPEGLKATWLCNRMVWKLPGCATGRSESYPVVQRDGLKATQLCNWTVWKLPGCATERAESYPVSKWMVWSYPKVQHDSLKATRWCNWTCSSLGHAVPSQC